MIKNNNKNKIEEIKEIGTMFRQNFLFSFDILKQFFIAQTLLVALNEYIDNNHSNVSESIIAIFGMIISIIGIVTFIRTHQYLRILLKRAVDIETILDWKVYQVIELKHRKAKLIRSYYAVILIFAVIFVFWAIDFYSMIK